MSRLRARLVALTLATMAAPSPCRLTAGTTYGDAVPGIVRPSDLARIKLALHLDRFSVISAMRLGAEEGREVIVAEPLPDGILARVKQACDGGGFCPDSDGFVASRVRIVLLLDRDVETLVVVQKEARTARGRLVDLRDLGVTGEILGWSGRPDTADGHVALSLTPLTGDGEDTIAAGLDPPLLVRFNPAAGRFQVYDCVAGEDGQAVCDFKEETGG